MRTPWSASAAHPLSVSLRTLSERITLRNRVMRPSSVRSPPRSRVFRQPSQASSRTWGYAAATAAA